VRVRQQGGELPEQLEAAWQQADQAMFAGMRAALGYDAIRALVSGAAPIALELLEFFNAIGVTLYEVYGQTEDHGPTTINRLERFRLGTVGYAIPGGEVRIAEDGEVLYRGDNVCMGYYKNPEATRELIDDDGWMHSGDIGSLDKDGFLTITDRKKDIIITAAGKNIAPQVIEQKLKFSPWVSQALVIGDRRRYVTALLTLDEQSVRQFAEQKSIPFSSIADLAAHPDIVGLVEAHVAEVNGELSGPEQVKRFRILPEDFSVTAGTITPTLKVKRKPVFERYGDLIEAMYAAPASV
jgi:long-chain acyl-CoA synthetase